MIKTRKSILAVMIALFVVASFGLAAAEQIDGLVNGTTGRAIDAALPVGSGPSDFVGLSFSTALDIYVNPGAVGDSLIYNYYNADGMTTYFTVTNTDTIHGQRVRVRFREGADIAVNGQCDPEIPLGSWEVLDFDLCLSAGDMWSGYVSKNATTGGAQLCAMDSDTLVFDGTATPAIFSSVFGGCAQFKFLTANPVDTITAKNTLEGYFEMIGEERLAGKPTVTECQTPSTPGATADDADNALVGSAAVINNADGATYTYNATALANTANASIAFGVTTSQPDLADATESLSAVNFVLTKDRMYSIYDLAGSQTELVVLFPTKLLTYQYLTCDNMFNDLTVGVQVWSDDEQTVQASGCHASPCVGQPGFSLPYELNVVQVDMNDGSVISDFLKSQVVTSLKTKFDFGWIGFDFTQDSNNVGIAGHSTTVGAAPAATSHGWPALGLTMLNVGAGTSTGAFPMQYTNQVSN